MSAAIFNTDTVNAKINYAQQLATARLLPKDFAGNPGNCLLAIELAESLDVHPMVVITGVHIMNGKITDSAGLIGSLVRRAGHKLRVVLADDQQSATATLIRSDDPDFTYSNTFTIEDARRANLLKNATWNAYGPAMLKARAMTQVARDGAPDAIAGLAYTLEEMGEDVALDGNGNQHRIDQLPPARDWKVELEEAGTADAVTALWREATNLRADQLVIDAIVAKGKVLREAEAAAELERATTAPLEDAAEQVDEKPAGHSNMLDENPLGDWDPAATQAETQAAA